MSQFPTSKENIALDLIFESMGESRINRTYAEYMAIASRLPMLEPLRQDVNNRLSEMAVAGDAPYEICYFKAGDQGRHRYDKFPTSLSIETIRTALIKSGMKQPRGRRKPRP